MISSQDRQFHNLEHCRWRVAFRKSIFDAHRASAKTGEEWVRKEEAYLQWLKEAKADLYRLEHSLNYQARVESRCDNPQSKERVS
jgi:hypothetical protein